MRPLECGPLSNLTGFLKRNGNEKHQTAVRTEKRPDEEVVISKPEKKISRNLPYHQPDLGL